MVNLDVLLIDDTAIIREYFQEALEEKGCKVNPVKTCSEGIDIFSQDPKYQLVITDLNQTPESGLDVVRVVKEKNPQTEVYIVTAGGNPLLEDEAKKLIGADHVLMKPEVTPKKLFEIVDNTYTKYTTSQS